ncbi:hypothetical protein AMECASPLE_033185 [Ameca splendens]|uniref:Uncharacterized protein n=1 Tax=Ameca splendens TaxID=208324 RepID=A0ABV0Y7C2_9TELE
MIDPTKSFLFDQFKLPADLWKIVGSLKPTNCPMDMVPTRVPKSVFNTVGPTLLFFINCWDPAMETTLKLRYTLFWNFQNKLHLTDFQQLRKGGVAADVP